MPERRFYIAWGLVGDDEAPQRSKEGEMWNVRRAAMALAKTGAEKYREAGQEAAAECYEAIYVRFLEAGAGVLLFGLTVEIEIGGTTRFIAFVPAGAEASENQEVNHFREGDTVAKVQRTHPISNPPSISSVRASERTLWPSTPPSSSGPSRKKAQRASEEDVARKIAAEMAAATRKAVEG